MIKKFISDHKWLFLLIFLGLAVKFTVLHFALKEVDFRYDDLRADGYYEIAYNLLNNEAYSRDLAGNLEPDSIRTPGLPILIYASLYFFNTTAAFIYFQILVSAFIPVLVVLLALKSGLKKIPALIIGFFIALEPMSLSLSVKMLTEIFFSFFFLLSLVFIADFFKYIEGLRSGKIIIILSASAISLSIATFFRPSSFYLPFLLSLAWIIYRVLKRKEILVKYVICFILLSNALTFPWMYRNHKVFNSWSYSSVQDQVLFSALAPSVMSLEKGTNYPESQKAFFRSQGFDSFPEVFSDRAPWFRQRALEYAFGHPKGMMAMSALSIFTFFTHDGTLEFLGVIGQSDIVSGFPHFQNILTASIGEKFIILKGIIFSPALLILGMRMIWLIIFIGFAFGTVDMIRKKRLKPIHGLFVLIILYFALTSISNGLAINARFRFPVNGLIAIVAFLGIGYYNSSRISKAV